MLKMVDGTGIIGVDMICPLGVSTPQPPNYDRVELEGAGMLVLPNSLDAPLEGLELGGKTEQVQTTGANLFDEKLLLDFDSENYDKTQSGSGFYYYKFPVNGTVTASTKNANKNGEYLTVGIKPDGSDKTWLSHGSAAISKYKTLTPEDGNIYLGVNNSLERVKSMIQNTGGIIINEGSAAKPYEPYTGGKPSPSPEYPQEIKNSGMWNEETRKYEVDVKVTGRNLFNGKLLKGKSITDDMNVVSDLVTMNTFDKPVEIEPNTDYVISANGVIWEGNINVYDENGKKIVQHFTGKFKTPSNAKYIRASISNARAPIDSKIQMEYGTAMNEFEQYHQPQTLTLTSDRPLTKWDRLVEQGGQIGWLYKSKIIDGFDGQSSNITLGGKQGEVQHFSVVFTDVPNGNGNGDIYVDRYRAIAMSYTKAEFGICCNWNIGVKFFFSTERKCYNRPRI